MYGMIDVTCGGCIIIMSSFCNFNELFTVTRHNFINVDTTSDCSAIPYI